MSYFKRVKQPVSSPEEAKPIVKETKIYFSICFVGCIVFCILYCIATAVLNNAILSNIFMAIAIVALIPTFYFGIMLYAMKRVVKRMKNLQCDACKAKLCYDEYTSWKEVRRHWSNSSSDKRAEAKLYVTVDLTCKCPNCGKIKTFTETLCSGKISVSDYSLDDTIVSTQSLVEDYFAGTIHA